MQVGTHFLQEGANIFRCVRISSHTRSNLEPVVWSVLEKERVCIRYIVG